MAKLIVALDFDVNPEQEKGPLRDLIAKEFTSRLPRLRHDVRFVDTTREHDLTPREFVWASYNRTQELLAHDPAASWCVVVRNIVPMLFRESSGIIEGKGQMCIFARRGAFLAEFLLHYQHSGGTELPKEIGLPLELMIGEMLHELPAPGRVTTEERRVYTRMRDSIAAGFTAHARRPNLSKLH